MNIVRPGRILHVITDLGMGGAEMALFKLLSRLSSDDFTSEVVSLTTDQPMGERIRGLGVRVTALNLRPSFPDPRLMLNVASHIRRFRPDLIQTWMYHADLIGGLAARLAGSPPVVWNIRHATGNLSEFKPSTRLVVQLDAILSHSLPRRIVCNAEAGQRSHVKLGYDAEKMLVIPNGFNLDAFRPDPRARREVRQELGIREETPLIGLCARFHPDKDHHNFFQAARLLHAGIPDVHFLLWGKGMDLDNPQIATWLDEAELKSLIHLTGQRDDSPRLTAALDVATLSSSSEAFPTVVGEAMACEVPCAVTDVGDAAHIIGDTGRVIPPRNPKALAYAWAELLSLSPAERATLGRKARQRVATQFDLGQTAAAYAQLYRDIIAGFSK